VFSSARFWLGFTVLVYLVVALVVRSRRPRVPVWGVMAFASFMVVVLVGLVLMRLFLLLISMLFCF
jgi:hypothetical protein